MTRFLTALHTKGLLYEGRLPEALAGDPAFAGLGSQRALLADLGAEPEAIGHVVVLPAYAKRFARGAKGVLSAGVDELRQKDVYILAPSLVTLLDTGLGRTPIRLTRPAGVRVPS